MSTDQQRKFGRMPLRRKPKNPERDPMSGKPLDELRLQQAQLRREFYERRAKKAA